MVWFPYQRFPQTQIWNDRPVIVTFLNFSLNRTVLNFLRRSVDDNSNNNYFYSLS